MHRYSSRNHGRAFLVGIALIMALPVSRVDAQNDLHACYVPASGTVYRIKTGGDTKETCASDQHVAFSWSDGNGAQHGTLSGLSQDHHTQYLLSDGVRDIGNALTVTGTFGSGQIWTAGQGTRLMWFPGKAALRAGQVAGSEWDYPNLGDHSVAMGLQTIASGAQSMAMGRASVASGSMSTAMGSFSVASGVSSVAIGAATNSSGTGSTAMGSSTVASGNASTAMGAGSQAGGNQSTAIGAFTKASGDFSTALGRLSNTNGMAGSFVYGDATIADISSFAPNQFLVRASGGTFIYSNADANAGVYLWPGAGAWAALSDARKKTAFRAIDAESVLAKISAMPILEWSYRAQDTSIRHVGPTAQDFRVAFGLGESDTTITSVDIDGINLLAAQALVRRTTELQSVNSQLQQENAAHRSRLDALEARLLELEQLFRAGRRDP